MKLKKKLVKKRKPVGKPPMFKSVDEMQSKLVKYFKNCEINGDPPCVTGMALALGCWRQTIINYEFKKEFVDTIKRAKLICENWVEHKMLNGEGKNIAGLIFNAKNNYGWKEKVEYDHNVRKVLHLENEDKTPEQLKFEANELADRIIKRRVAINQIK